MTKPRDPGRPRNPLAIDNEPARHWAWQDQARCADTDDPTRWCDIHDPDQITAALKACRGCPVVARCAKWAAGEPLFEGVAGGRLLVGQPLDVGRCGTVGGFQGHARAGQSPCQECLAAARYAHNRRGTRPGAKATATAGTATATETAA